MIAKSDWQEAYDKLLEDGRGRVGPPPDFDTIQALFDGRLPEAEAARVREALAYYPELAEVMTTPFPEASAPVLTDLERAADLAKLRDRIRRLNGPDTRRRVNWSRLALAAGIILAVALATLVFTPNTSIPPRSVSVRTLISDEQRATRGSAALAYVLSNDEDYVLKPLYRPREVFREYRFELVDVGGTSPQSVRTYRSLARQPDGSIPIELSTANLPAGLYELVLYGVDGQPRRLATYSIRIDTGTE